MDSKISFYFDTDALKLSYAEDLPSLIVVDQSRSIHNMKIEWPEGDILTLGLPVNVGGHFAGKIVPVGRNIIDYVISYLLSYESLMERDHSRHNIFCVGLSGLSMDAIDKVAQLLKGDVPMIVVTTRDEWKELLEQKTRNINIIYC